MTPTNWAKRRKLIYTLSVAGVVLLTAGIMSFKAFYRAPTCFDGRQNGGETGIDCGGGCARVCEDEAQPLRVKWEKSFKIREGVYSAVAYIENPNMAIGAESLPYEFKFYNATGKVVGEVRGESYSAPHTSFPIFEGPIYLDEEPARVEFSFLGNNHLVRSERSEIPIKVENATLMSSETRPKINALLTNESIDTLGRIDVVALVFDGSGDAVAASRTVVPELRQGARERVVFTWPEAFRAEYETCSMPTSTVLAIDRSGSMNDLGANPPQPITDALGAADAFVSRLTKQDRVGVVSYATDSSVVAGITFDKAEAASAIASITILPEDETGYTNIGAAIKDAHSEIMKVKSNVGPEESLVIILLTDGEANWPLEPTGERYAEMQAALARQDNVTIYTIGLGDNVNRSFLSSIATSPSHYFEAISTEDLEGIYEEIASAVCTYGPSVIEITPRYNNVSKDR